MFADHGADVALVPMMAAAGFAGAMLDTAAQGSRPTARRTRHHGLARVRRRVPHARSRWRASPARWSRPTFRACCCSSRTCSAFAARSCVGRRSRRPDRRRRGRHGARADPARSAQRRAPGGSGPRRRSTIGCWRRAAIRSSPARTRRPTACSCAISCCRSRIGAYAHEREKPQRVALQCRGTRVSPRPRGRGHARRVLLRHRHRRHSRAGCARAFRVRRDARGADRGAGRSPTRGWRA